MFDGRTVEHVHVRTLELAETKVVNGPHGGLIRKVVEKLRDGHFSGPRCVEHSVGRPTRLVQRSMSVTSPDRNLITLLFLTPGRVGVSEGFDR